ncbi:hypothetical protein ABT026_28940 [Streptomyces sp. NPDC002734]|uniref:hypothetical protein n=1 Tax=Streptomyces sp. NPDC002734 TaxID=3154426 RepID=UPI003325EFB4
MPVRTTTSCPAPAPGDGAATRLPWWGVVLPVLAFVSLLLLVSDPAAGPGPAELFTRLAQFAGR